MTLTRPPEDWPGLDPEDDGVEYDAEKIAAIAKELREIMKPIGGGGYGTRSGSIQDLSVNGTLSLVTTQLKTVDRWEGGEKFAATLESAERAFLDVYEDVLENFSTAITLVEEGAGTYRVTNIANLGA